MKKPDKLAERRKHKLRTRKNLKRKKKAEARRRAAVKA